MKLFVGLGYFVYFGLYMMRLLGAGCFELLLIIYEGFKLLIVVLLVEKHNSTAFNWAFDDNASIELEGLEGGMFFLGNITFGVLFRG